MVHGYTVDMKFAGIADYLSLILSAEITFEKENAFSVLE